MAAVIVAATSSGASPKPFSRSPFTGQVGGGRDGGGVGERLVAGDVAVEPTEGAGEAAARGGQRLEPEVGEQASGAHVPRVRHEQRLGSRRGAGGSGAAWSAGVAHAGQPTATASSDGGRSSPARRASIHSSMSGIDGPMTPAWLCPG